MVPAVESCTHLRSLGLWSSGTDSWVLVFLFSRVSCSEKSQVGSPWNGTIYQVQWTAHFIRLSIICITRRVSFSPGNRTNRSLFKEHLVRTQISSGSDLSLSADIAGAWIGMLFFDLTIFLMTVYKSISRWKEDKSHRDVTLLRILLVDGEPIKPPSPDVHTPLLP